MATRTFGWVQDPSNWESLRKVVTLLVPGSEFNEEMRDRIARHVSPENGRDNLLTALSRDPLRISYRELIGSHNSPRSNSQCNGIIQAAIPGQKRDFIGDWPADNFLRWAHCMQFVTWHQEDDTFSVTKEGLALSQTTLDSDEEYQIYAHALASYPPAVQIMKLLNDAKPGSMTKFALGENLGFKGERGFTNISESFFVSEYLRADTPERRIMRSDMEGDSDKYARMICKWMGNLKYEWVRREEKEFSDSFGNNASLSAFCLTAQGVKELKRTTGESSCKRTFKFVPYQMLCTKGASKEFLRERRARVLKSILSKKEKSIGDITAELKAGGIIAKDSAIQNDLEGLTNIGLDIAIVEDNLGVLKYRCVDSVHGLHVSAHLPPLDDEILQLMEECREKLTTIPSSYVELIQMGFEKRQSRLFEIKIIELLTVQCGFRGKHLGQSSRPDGIVHHDANKGVIIDSKSYRDGFRILAAENDKMFRYVHEASNPPTRQLARWWENFPDHICVFVFLFVSGKFIGDIQKQLHALGEKTKCGGAAISATTLLLLADKIAAQQISHEKFIEIISCLKEVKADD